MSRTPAPEVAPPDLPGYRFVTNIGSGGNAQVYLYEQNLRESFEQHVFGEYVPYGFGTRR